ncbi:MAG: hypothetical protein RLZZ136_1448 [Pseudomonadota bacterium]
MVMGMGKADEDGLGNNRESGGVPSTHDLMQPLNVIQLASGNLRSRILPMLGGDDADYLISKLDRIEQQVARMATMLSGAQ